MADYKVRLVAGRYCLAETKNNWIVGCGYNPDRPEGQQWEQGKYFSKANGLTGLLSLHEATEYMYSRLDENYIPRERLRNERNELRNKQFTDEELRILFMAIKKLLKGISIFHLPFEI